MNTVTIDYIWEAIRESERSDELQYMDDRLRMNAEAARLTELLHIESAAETCELAAKTTISLVPGR